MAETKINFIKSKMNKDLDDRLLGNGEYREGVNIAVNKSEDSDVGALENILGNFLISEFESGNSTGLSIIGNYMDYTNDKIIVFLTNYTDSSSNGLSNYSTLGANNFIVSYDLNTNQSTTLVSGRFLNFSKNSPIDGINMIEDLLFWSDNRNQPRKINVTRAFDSSTYYTNEDQISVAKYFPYKPLTLYNSTEIAVTSVTTVTAFSCRFSCNTVGLNIKKGDYIIGAPAQVSKVQIVDVQPTYIETNYGTRSYQLQYNTSSSPTKFDIKILSAAGKDKATEHLPLGLMLKTAGGNLSSSAAILQSGDTIIKVNPFDANGGRPSLFMDINNTSVMPAGGAYPSMGVKPGMRITIPGNNQKLIITNVTESANNTTPAEIEFSPSYQGQAIWRPNIGIHSQNPNYDANWPGDKNFLENKFVRFSYRFQFDDGEYSLIAPFSQPVFVPKQMSWLTDLDINDTATYTSNVWANSPSWYTYRVDGSVTLDPSTNITTPTRFGGSGEIVPQLRTAAKDTVVSWFENKVNNIEINIPTEYPVNEMGSKLKIKSFEIVYKESDAISIKSVDEIFVTDTAVINNATKTLTYQYQSRKPIKTLPETETTRVYDKVPIRAQAQEVAGNRVIYGNFLDQHTPPPSLDFQVNASDKFPEWSSKSSEYTQVSYPLHSLKQDRNYEVGIILSDRYGRQSSVIPATVNLQDFTQDGLTFGSSSIYHPYREGVVPTTAQATSLTNSSYPYADIKDWWGDSLKLAFINQIPSNISSNAGYPGLYKELSTTARLRNTAGSSGQPLSYYLGDTSSYTNPNIEIGSTAQFFDTSGQEVSSIVQTVLNDAITISPEYSVNNPIINANMTFSAGSNIVSVSTQAGLIDPSTINVGMIVRSVTGVFDPVVEEIFLNNAVPPLVTSLKLSDVGSASGVQVVNLENEIKFIDDSKVLGWYSYKVVVKQNQQEYYNVYLPNLVNGEPYILENNTGTTGFLNTYTNINQTATVSLLTDNVNKVPPDLLDIVPNQEQFKGSTSLLTPRISIIQRTASAGNSFYTNIPMMIFPKEQKEEILAIGQYESLYGNSLGINGAIDNTTTPPEINKGPISLWKGETNPPTVRVTNKFQIGNNYARNPNFTGNTVASFFSTVVETEPVVSNIDIYYETSTSGLVSELNEAIRQSQLENTPAQFSGTLNDFNMTWPERTTPVVPSPSYGAYPYVDLTGDFYIQNSASQNLTDAVPTLTGISRSSSPFISDQFRIIAGTSTGQFKIQGKGVTWNSQGCFVESDLLNPWTIDLSVFNNGVTTALQLNANKQNSAPTVLSATDQNIVGTGWNVDTAIPATDPNGTRSWNYWQKVTSSGWTGAGGMSLLSEDYYVYGVFNDAGTAWTAQTVGYPSGATPSGYSETGNPFVLSQNGSGSGPPSTTFPYIMGGFTSHPVDPSKNACQPTIGNGGPTGPNPGAGGGNPFTCIPATQPLTWSGTYPESDYAAGRIEGAQITSIDRTVTDGCQEQLVLSYNSACPYWKLVNGVWVGQNAGTEPALELSLVQPSTQAQAGTVNWLGSTIAIRPTASKAFGEQFWLNLVLTDANGQGDSTNLRIHVILTS